SARWPQAPGLCTGEGRPRARGARLGRRVAGASGGERNALARGAAECAQWIGLAEHAADLWTAGLADEALAPAARAALLPRVAAVLWNARRLAEWAGLAEEELAGGEPSPERRLELHRELARAWAGPLSRPERALPHLRALADGPTPADAERALLLATLRTQGSGLELAQRLVAWLRTRPEDVAAWRELARLYEERLGLAAAAADAWRE